MTSQERMKDATGQDYSTLEVARRLGMAVRSIQLMVDRGELTAWKTPGGHRRIDRASVEAWLERRSSSSAMPLDEASSKPTPTKTSSTPSSGRQSLLLIEDSVHFQKLVGLLIEQQFPELDLHIASDGIVGLAMFGQLQPDILIVDILLPGIDGPTLITALRSQPQFARSQLIVLTSLDEAQRAPYAFALSDVPVVHKPRLVMDLPPLLKTMAHKTATQS
ncbi:excisionase family DNA-binding protein [Paucibacter sp. Y2R2-4]|uniref:excisionase family DNA-binding protein n=1 Tax=Paucibacter sp. Y2R2-4 TaxID=2893553 RepID=UPI0021E509DE|nr:excisionase family DNA-binding protein [Paucibacter sp. Y2R2-4]MCV2350910.1 excisionase family DNA-binding protein [Paucibacter sp. Y2R2-4]